MSKRNKIYFALILTIFIFFAFLVVRSKILGTHEPVFDFLERLCSFTTFLICMLWLRNRAAMIGLFILSINLNLDLFRYILSGWNQKQIIQNSFWPIGFVCIIIAVICFSIAFSKDPKLVYWTKRTNTTKFTIAFYLVAETVLFQMIIKLL